MRLDIHVHLPNFVADMLNRLLDASRSHSKEVYTMSEALEHLKAEVAENTTIVKSAIALITGLSARIRELADQVASGDADETDLSALADSLDTDQALLADAMVANTPSQNEPQGEEITTPSKAPEADPAPEA